MRSAAGVIVRNHWLLGFGWILFQYILGRLLAHDGKLGVGSLVLFDSSSLLKAESVFETHKASAVGLFALGSFLVAVKIYMSAISLARPKIKNAMIATWISKHFIGFFVMILIQILTMGDYRDDVSRATGLDGMTLLTIHKVTGFLMLVNATGLLFVRLLYLKGTDSAKDKRGS